MKPVPEPVLGLPVPQRIIGRASKRPTISDVATRAGVSRTTVSRVLNSRGELAEETIQRVRVAIDELGYRPSEIARSLSFQRTRTVGMIVYDILNPGMAACVYGAQVELAKHDYQVILTCMGGHLETARACLSLLEGRRVDGIISGILLDGDGTALLRQSPHFLMHGVHCIDLHSDRASRVSFDEAGGGRQAAHHLLDLGHRRIGIVTGPNWWDSIKERLAAFRVALAERGCPLDPLLIESTDEWTVPAGHAATLRLLDRAPDLTAIWALYDILGIGVIRALQDRGRRVPDDVAVIGYNNEVFASYTVPRLTSVRADCNMLGSVAAKLTLALLDDEEAPPEEVIVPTELVARESTVGLVEAQRQGAEIDPIVGVEV